MTPFPSPSFFRQRLHLWAGSRWSNSSRPHAYSEPPPPPQKKEKKRQGQGFVPTIPNTKPGINYVWCYLLPSHRHQEISIVLNHPGPALELGVDCPPRHPSWGRDRCTLNKPGILLGEVKMEMTPGMELKKINVHQSPLKMLWFKMHTFCKN